MVHSCERDSSAFLPSHVAIEPITKGLLSASLDSPVAIAEQKVSAKRRLKRSLGSEVSAHVVLNSSSSLLSEKSAFRLRLFRYLCVSTN
jgi:hypothetical protein